MTIAGRLWTTSLQSIVLILLILIIRQVLRKYPKIYSYSLWSLVGLRLLCPIWPESPFSLQPQPMDFAYIQEEAVLPEAGDGLSQMTIEEEDSGLPDAVKGQENSTLSGSGNVQGSSTLSGLGNAQGSSTLSGSGNVQESSTLSGPGNVQGSIALSGIRDQGNGTADVGTGMDVRGVYQSLIKLLVIIYTAGAAGLFCFYLIQYARVRKWTADAVREEENVWLSDCIASPFVMGIWKGKIFLPYGLAPLARDHILRHERMHIRHRDPLIRWLGILCICLHWWNPFVWLAVHKMNQDMEMFCDESALSGASMEEKKAYSKVLLDFAEQKSGLSVGLAFGESNTEQRVRNIMNKRRGRILITCAVALVAIVSAVTLMTVPGESQAQGDSPFAGALGSPEEASPPEGTIFAGLNGEVTLSKEDITYLQEICPRIPVFDSGKDLDVAAWAYYLFSSYTSDFDKETVRRFSPQYGFETDFVKVSQEEVEETVRQIFGKPLWEYGVTPQDITKQLEGILFEEGSYYVSVSDSPDYAFSLERIEEVNGLVELEFLEGVAGEQPYAQVRLFLDDADTERGFRIAAKERNDIPTPMADNRIEDTVTEVDMTPYGVVTFAAIYPHFEENAYADVAFKLYQNGQEREIVSAGQSRRDQWVFQEVMETSFPDINADGFTDIIAISSYRQGDALRTEARIFTGSDTGFAEETYLEEAYNESHEDKSAVDVVEFVSLTENQDYFVETSIYGRWSVVEYIPTKGISAVPQEDIEKIEGSWLTYGRSAYRASWLDTAKTVEHYQKELVTAQEFNELYGVATTELGLANTYFTYYELEGVSDTTFGTHFYMIDSENAIMLYDGAFFRVTRV